MTEPKFKRMIPGSSPYTTTQPVANQVTPIDPTTYQTKYLLNGSSNDMGVDGSSTPVVFSYTPPSGYQFEVARIMTYMEAGTNFASDKFMNLTALTNGVVIACNGISLTTWQDNVDIALDMYDFNNLGTAFSLAARSLCGRWTFTKGTNGEPLMVNDGNSFTATVNDDLSAAGIIFRIKVQGQYVAA